MSDIFQFVLSFLNSVNSYTRYTSNAEVIGLTECDLVSKLLHGNRLTVDILVAPVQQCPTVEP